MHIYLQFFFVVTADEEGPADYVRVNIIFPGLKKKFFRNSAKNAVLEMKYDTRFGLHLITYIQYKLIDFTAKKKMNKILGTACKLLFYLLNNINHYSVKNKIQVNM